MNECLRGLRQTLIVRLEPSIAAQPSEGALHYPAPRHHREPPLPFCFAHDIEVHLAPFARSPDPHLQGSCIAPSAQITRNRRNSVARTGNNVRAPSRSCTLASVTATRSTKPSVSTSRWRLRPHKFLAPSYCALCRNRCIGSVASSRVRRS
jgi:hypothetical protein